MRAHWSEFLFWGAVVTHVGVATLLFFEASFLLGETDLSLEVRITFLLASVLFGTFGLCLFLQLLVSVITKDPSKLAWIPIPVVTNNRLTRGAWLFFFIVASLFVCLGVLVFRNQEGLISSLFVGWFGVDTLSLAVVAHWHESPSDNDDQTSKARVRRRR